MANTDIHYTILLSKGPVNEDGSLGQDGANGIEGISGVSGVNSKADNTGQTGQNGTETGWWKKTCKCATSGTVGANGVSAGNDGTVAGDGDSPYPFILRVNTFEIPENANLNIQGRGGNGGTGGAGGKGGNGDFGGNAGLNKDDCINNDTCQPALGGVGGKGMPGGKGGKGGDAGNGGNILINYVNTKCVNQIVPYYQGGKVGNHGDPGPGGDGGKGGQNEIFPREGEPTFASPGNTGPTTGDNGSGNPAQPGTYNLIQVSKIPPP